MQPSEHFKKIVRNKSSDLDFQSWFNGAKSLEENMSSGFTDFVHKIFTQDFYEYIGDPSIKTVLEIGCGGGRLLYPAACFFKHVIGVDIHDEMNRVASFLQEQNKQNFTLLNSNSIDEIADDSLDFIYSFITFQHFDSWQVALDYFSMLQQKMRSGSVGVIYFGNNKLNDLNFHIEQPKNFDDFPMTMYVKPEFVIAEMAKFGLFKHETGVTTKRPWSRPDELSRQFYVKFSKR